MLFLKSLTAGPGGKELKCAILHRSVKPEHFHFNKQTNQGRNGELWDFRRPPASWPQNEPPNTQLRPPDHTPSPESQNNNQSTPRISQFGFFSSFSERDPRFEWSLPCLSSPEPGKAMWFFPQQDTQAQVFGRRVGGSGVSAQVPVKSINFLSLWLKLVSLDQQFDIFPLWCYIHVSTFNMSD